MCTIIWKRTHFLEGSYNSQSETEEDSDLVDQDDEVSSRMYNDTRSENQEDIAYELPDGGMIVCLGVIGQGHYGIVYRGSYEKNDTDPAMEVAIKTFNNNNSANQHDFEREINIMKVNNIIELILIVYWTIWIRLLA